MSKLFSFPTIWHENKSGNIGIHEFSCAVRANASHNYLLVNGKRRLTPRENLRLMGFPDAFKIVVPDRAIRRQAGNSVVIPMIQAVAEAMLLAMKAQPKPQTSHIARQHTPSPPTAWKNLQLPIEEYAK
jgi:DNA (cytosine-5)-methyltransferase 1